MHTGDDMKKLIIAAIIIISAILAGCTNNETLFESPDIVAYIDGEPMYGLFGLNKNNFIEYKILLTRTEIFGDSEAQMPSKEEAIGKSYFDLEQISLDMYFELLANTYLDKSQEDKEIDFYIMLITYNRGEETEEFFNDSEAKDEFELFVNDMLSNYTEEVFEEDILSVELAEKYNCTFEEFVDEFIKPYIPFMFIDIKMAPNSFVYDNYTGDIPEINDDLRNATITEENYDEIVQYLKDIREFQVDAREQYIDFIAKDIDKSKIIERP